ncbi:hypothetical protein Atc_2091 [Acidithiobacillus caldus SM-1]|uniref:Uncharacterized protein n=1 Tax=Acidithiobacillus caldus (strain SM-1) TaxID=990288 RepID=F9ZR45_ACICS|nr:hypothetical protein Atc_2091 [Acidithiobacillus caldus SM-1]
MWHWLTATPGGSIVFLSIGVLLWAFVYFLPSLLGFLLQVPSPAMVLFVNGLSGWLEGSWLDCVFDLDAVEKL